MEKSELEALCQELFYRKIPILLVQSTETYRLSNEIQWILDNDLCEIYWKEKKCGKKIKYMVICSCLKALPCEITAQVVAFPCFPLKFEVWE